MKNVVKGSEQVPESQVKADLFAEQGYTRPLRALSRTLEEWERAEDELQAKTDIEIYSEMQDDPDVKSALGLKIGAVLGGDINIHPAVRDTEDNFETAKEQAEFIDYCLEKMDGGKYDWLEEVLLDSLGQGIGFCEKNFRYNEDPERFTGLITLKSIKAKPPKYLEVKLDDFNNVKGMRIKLGSEEHPLDPDKFAVLTYNGKYGHPFGRSDLRGAYRYWWAKQRIFEWWLVFSERFGMPTALGKVPKGTPPDKREEFLDMLDSIHQDTSVVIDNDQEVEMLTGNQTEKGGYEASLDYCGRQIAKSIVGNTLTTDQGTKGTGSYAQSKTHQDTLDVWVAKLKTKVEEFFNERIIKHLIDLNFKSPMYPRLDLGKVDDKDIVALAEALERLVNAGFIWAGEGWIRDFLGIPEKSADDLVAEEEEKAEKDAQQAAMQDALVKANVASNQANDPAKYPEEPPQKTSKKKDKPAQ